MKQPVFSLNRLFLHSTAGGPRLKIGALVPSSGMPRYGMQVLTDIAACDFAQLECVVVVEAPSGHDRPDGLLFRSYERFLSHTQGTEPDPLEIVQVDWSGQELVEIEAQPQRAGRVLSLPDAVLHQVSALHLDVILQFGLHDLRGEIHSCSRFGTWSLRHDEARWGVRAPPMLWELITNQPTSAIILKQLGTDDSDDREVCRSSFTTTDTISAAENAYGPFWCSTHLFIQKLHELHVKGRVAARTPSHESQLPRPSGSSARPAGGIPDSWQMARWLARTGLQSAWSRTGTLARRLAGRLTTLHWQIGIRPAGTLLMDEPSIGSALTSFKWLKSPTDHFWADPFLFSDDSRTLLFFEDFSYDSKLGTVAVAELTDDGNLADVRTVLERPYHLSYPQVFTHDGETWMVPESSEAGAIELWRAVQFPDKWELEARIVEVRAVDPTLVQHNGYWWLFATPMPVMGRFAQTYLWMARSLTGPWRLHDLGDIQSDVSRSRPAGPLFEHGGRLIRPSQDCSGRYGRALWFNEVTQLDESHYCERPFIRVAAQSDLGITGLHTYTYSAQWEAIDGLFRQQLSIVRR